MSTTTTTTKENKGRAFQLPKVEGASKEVAASLQDWLQDKWDNNCRYGEGSIKVFAEIAEKFYKLGKESKE